MMMRQASAKNYRYGFNGKENDNEVKGIGNVQDYGERIYDNRLGRFLSVDPITREYPELTPYQFASNRPIDGIDQDGMEFEYYLAKLIDRLMDKADEKADEIKSKPTKTTAEKAFLFTNGLAKSTPFGAAHQIKKTVTSYAKMSPQQQKAAREANQQHLTKMLTTYVFNGPVNGSAKIIADEFTPTVQRAVSGDYEAMGEVTGIVAQVLGPKFFGGSAPKVPLTTSVNIPTRLVRVIPEEIAGNAKTLGKTADFDVFVTSADDLKGLTTSEQISKRLALYTKDGNLVKGPFRLIEFDTPSEGLAQPFNRNSPGFINGGKTAGGATEYVVPNASISSLKNVTQTVIK